MVYDHSRQVTSKFYKISNTLNQKIDHKVINEDQLKITVKL